MSLEHSARVADARKILAERPVTLSREQLAERIEAACDAAMVDEHPDAVMDVVWPLIENKDVAIAKREAALEQLLDYVDELLKIVGEVAT